MEKRTYNSEAIVRAVKVIIDENESSEPLIAEMDTDQLQTDELIRSLISHALNRICMSAPNELISDMAVSYEASLMDGALQALGNRGYGKYVVAPKDAIRLVSVYAADWEQPVREFITADDARYQLQRSRIAGVRGTIYDPVVAYVNNPMENGSRIELYTTEEDKANVMYIPSFTDGDGEESEDASFSLTSRIYSALLYAIANLYFVSIGESGRAEMMAGEVNHLLGLS